MISRIVKGAHYTVMVPRIKNVSKNISYDVLERVSGNIMKVRALPILSIRTGGRRSGGGRGSAAIK